MCIRDRHIEHSVTVAFLAETIKHFTDCTQDLKPMYLVSGKVNQGGLVEAKRAILPCGDVFAADIVILCDGRVGRVLSFWQEEGEDDVICVSMECFAATADPCVFNTSAPVVLIFTVEVIVEPLAWCEKRDARIRVILPLTQ